MTHNNENKDKINPNSRTNPKDYSKAKINSSKLKGDLFKEFRDWSQ